jgi:hypothetical protein
VLPVADLVTVREVLQHLTNKQISDILRNIERTRFKYALITEHIVSPAKMLAPNLDLPTHSPDTRVALRSGVMINEAPFSKPATIVFEIPVAEKLQRVGGEDERLCVFFWDFTKKARSAAGGL